MMTNMMMNMMTIRYMDEKDISCLNVMMIMIMRRLLFDSCFDSTSNYPFFI